MVAISAFQLMDLKGKPRGDFLMHRSAYNNFTTKFLYTIQAQCSCTLIKNVTQTAVTGVTNSLVTP